MLIFCIVDEGEDEIDALTHTGDQLPTGLQSLPGLTVAPLELLDLLIIELVSNDGITSHLGNEEHHSLDFGIELFLHLNEVDLQLLL